MKLKVFTEEGLELLEHNISANIKHYQKPDNKWIYEFMDEDKYIKDFHTEVQDFELKIDKKNVSYTDVENIKSIYINLKFLTNEQASNSMFWTGLTHLNFWEFMYDRWDIGEKGQSISAIERRYFINLHNSHRRSLIDNTLSKYWWAGKTLYDKEAEDPFYLLKYLELDYSTKTLNLLSSSYANNDEIIRVIINTIFKIEKDIERKLNRQEFREILSYLNILGGINILDYFSKSELKNKIKNRYYKEIKV